MSRLPLYAARLDLAAHGMPGQVTPRMLSALRGRQKILKFLKRRHEVQLSKTFFNRVSLGVAKAIRGLS